MDRTTIAQCASKMQTKEDLLALLNRIKRTQLEDIGLQDSFRPFTMRQLNFYCNPNNVFHRYRQFQIKKKSGGFREITSPYKKSFMMMLQALNEILKSLYVPSDYAMGFTEGRSVVTNASVHIGQNYILNIDLKDFFPSVEQWRVWKRLQLAPFNFSEQIASLIAGLCAMRVKREIPDESKQHENDKHYRYVLPQGAPTSPIITNMICDTLDHRLAGLAKRFGLRYSRYADDITFSSMHHVYQKDGEFWKELRKIISSQHFTINDDKTRLQRRGGRQEVTGIIVSEKLNVTQKYVRDIRNILYIWDRYGYSTAMAKFLPLYKSEKGHVKKGNPNLVNVIDGKLMYLKMVKGEEDSVYQRLHGKFATVVKKMNEQSVTTAQNVTYIETMPLLAFEKKHSTDVVITTSDSSHRYAYFMFDDKKCKASVNKNITPEDEGKKGLLALSLCLDEKGNTFWLIHRLDKVVVPKKIDVDIDELNNDLDSLINVQDG